MYLFNDILLDVQALFEKSEFFVGKSIADNIPAFLPINKDRLLTDTVIVESEKDIVKLVTMAIHTSFGAKLKFGYDQFVSDEHLVRSKLLSGTKFSLTELLQMITTHPVKNLEPKYFDGNVFCLSSAKDEPEDGDDFGILSKHTPEQAECVFSENAANLSYSKFLTLSVHHQGKTHTLPELLLNFECVRNLLVSAGIAKQELDDAIAYCQKMVDGVFPDNAQSTQIYWAIDDYAESLEYILITPVPSARMIRNIRKAAQSFYDRDDVYLPTTQKLLGGTQAQNVSDLNGKLGGRNHLLSANLGFIGKYKSELDKRLVAKKPLISNLKPSLNDIILSEALHYKQKPLYSNRLKSHFVDAMALYFEYLDIEHDDSAPDLSQEAERQYCLSPYDINAINSFSDYLYNKLIACWNHHNRAPDSETRRFAKETITAFVKEGL